MPKLPCLRLYTRAFVENRPYNARIFVILCRFKALLNCLVNRPITPTSHPGFICRNIPYSLAYRFVRIESTQEELDGQELGQTDEGVGKPRLQSCKCVSGNGEVPRPANQRPVFCLPYDPRLPGVAGLLRKRHKALLERMWMPGNTFQSRLWLLTLGPRISGT